jgi:putative alpha-1,2-mannosidase
VIAGMAKAVADVDSDSNQGGFSLDGGNVTGFSTMHDSGTGGNPSLGNFALFPYAGCKNDEVDGCIFPKTTRKLPYVDSSVKSTPGYFEVALTNGLKASMTAAHHTGLFRFNLPTGANSSHPLILLDLTDLSNSRQDNGTVTVDETTGRMTGSGRFQPSFGSGTYVLYFCADFTGADIYDTGIWANDRGSTSVKTLTISRGINSGGPLPGGAFVRFQQPSNGELVARLAVSFISSDQACKSAEAEIPDFDFDSIQNAAVAAWRSKLSAITVSTSQVDSSLVTNFYSGVYRTMVNPQNYTNENPLWQSSEPYFDSFYW